MTIPANAAATIESSVTFGEIEIDERFSANQWGHGCTHVFVKRDAKTATSAAVYDDRGHPKRGWNGRTQFSKRDAVIRVTG
jgi:hypothetical protein